jgi:outer membrane protein TolC
MMRMTPTRPLPAALLALIASGLLCACSLAPGYQRPAAPIPAQWPAGDAAPETGTATRPDWQHFVQDAQLRALIALALDHNRDLRQAGGRRQP